MLDVSREQSEQHVVPLFERVEQRRNSRKEMVGVVDARELFAQQEQVLIEQDELDERRAMLDDALSVLNERERRIFQARRLVEDPITLEDLSTEFDISRERVRQIEVRAFEKVQDAVKASAVRRQKALRTIEA